MTPYLDTDFALKQVGGDQVLLENMFKRFIQQYGQAHTDTQALMASHNWQDARQLVHSIKGVAGNLGMTPLYQAATDLEQLLKQGDPEAERYLPAFVQALDNTLVQLAGLNSTPSQNTQSQPNQLQDANAYEALLASLKRNEFVSPSHLEQWLNALALDSESHSKLRDLICDLEYAQAIQLLEQVRDAS